MVQGPRVVFSKQLVDNRAKAYVSMITAFFHLFNV